MLKTKKVTIQDLKQHTAKQLDQYSIPPGRGEAGTIEIALVKNAVRTFRAHWTGFRATYPKPIILMKASLNDGSFWTEGYISPDQPSWVLCFRKQPHGFRGTGSERPDDKFAHSTSLETSRSLTKRRREEGRMADEEIIRYEDFDSPAEAVEEFFNYMSFYCLRAAKVDWSGFGYVADPSIDWEDMGTDVRISPSMAAVEEGLKRSDILWLSVDTDPTAKPVPCWFVYTKDQRLLVLSGEPEQRIPYAAQVRSAKVVTRWKGRDARMVEFDAAVKPITAADGELFKETAQLLVSKRQSVRAGAAETIESWLRDAVILELFPRSS